MRTSNTLNLYQRPGPIENQSLLQEKNSMLLKGDLIEHHDFVALPGSIWKRLFAWYSADWSIMRMLREDSSHGVILDLYPLSLGGVSNETKKSNQLMDSQKSSSESSSDSSTDQTDLDESHVDDAKSLISLDNMNILFDVGQ